MFNKIKEAVSEAIGDGLYDLEHAEELRIELAELDKFEMEYAEFAEDSEFLNALRAAGVDNWTGYDYAQEMMRGE